jgi:hypothetical protein
MDSLQKLVKKKLEIDLEPAKRKLDLCQGEYAEQARYWSRRKRLEKAFGDAYLFGDDETLEKAAAELLLFYMLYGVGYAKKV